LSRPPLRATPFHARAAAANRDNAWSARNGVTLAQRYNGVEPEALGARLNVVLADISWRWRVMFEGARTEEFLSRLVTRNASALAPGAAFKALWLTDEGGVRGAGVVARLGRERFQLTASAPDSEWIAKTAALFDVPVRDISEETGGLALIGPYAAATLRAADLEPLGLQRLSWRGIEVTVTRWGEHGGFEIWCEPDDGVLVWDRLMRAGQPFGISPAGTEAIDTLDLEAGVARPNLDYAPARTGRDPTPVSLGLEKLVETAHAGFNGRKEFLSAEPAQRLVGLEIDSDTPAPFAPLAVNGDVKGHTLRSFYSPALRRAIALAFVDANVSAPGTTFTLALPPNFATPALRSATARIVPLPFLATPAAMNT
jgi:aminomethyltransferase